LPKWLIEDGNSSFVLLVYALAFGVGLPYIVVFSKLIKGTMVETRQINEQKCHYE
jgi:preprotein translocase subunit Sec63